MTGDDHGTTAPRASSTCSKATAQMGARCADWECVRATSYVYPRHVHPRPGSGFEARASRSRCISTPGARTRRTRVGEPLGGLQLPATFRASSVRTSRTHCIAWSDWVTTRGRGEPRRAPRHELLLLAGKLGARPPRDVHRVRLPHALRRNDGTLIDVYQAHPAHRRVPAVRRRPRTSSAARPRGRPEGYYGVSPPTCIRTGESARARGDRDAAQARGVPVVSARAVAGLARRAQRLVVPESELRGRAVALHRRAGPAPAGSRPCCQRTGLAARSSGDTRRRARSWSIRTVKGIDYAVFPAAAGAYRGDLPGYKDARLASCRRRHGPPPPAAPRRPRPPGSRVCTSTVGRRRAPWYARRSCATRLASTRRASCGSRCVARAARSAAASTCDSAITAGRLPRRRRR